MGWFDTDPVHHLFHGFIGPILVPFSLGARRVNVPIFVYIRSVSEPNHHATGSVDEPFHVQLRISEMRFVTFFDDLVHQVHHLVLSPEGRETTKDVRVWGTQSACFRKDTRR